MRLNQSITLTCKADALPKPRYLWKFDGKILGKAVQNTLTIRNAQVKDAGNYTCKAENFYGSKETTRMVNVECECIYDYSVINCGVLHMFQSNCFSPVSLYTLMACTTSVFRQSRETRCNQQQEIQDYLGKFRWQWLVRQAIGQSVSQAVSQSGRQTVSQPVSQPAGQSGRQAVS